MENFTNDPQNTGNSGKNTEGRKTQEAVQKELQDLWIIIRQYKDMNMKPPDELIERYNTLNNMIDPPFGIATDQ